MLKHLFNQHGPFGQHGVSAIGDILGVVLLNPLGWTCILAAMMTAIFWLLTITRFELSYVFPFLSLNFALIPLLSILILGEPFSWLKIIGIGMICSGVFVLSRAV